MVVFPDGAALRRLLNLSDRLIRLRLADGHAGDVLIAAIDVELVTFLQAVVVSDRDLDEVVATDAGDDAVDRDRLRLRRILGRDAVQLEKVLKLRQLTGELTA